MKKIIFSLAAVAMAAVASVNVYNVNANAVEMSELQKENVEALAGVEKKIKTCRNIAEEGRPGVPVLVQCPMCTDLYIVCTQGGGHTCIPTRCLSVERNDK